MEAFNIKHYSSKTREIQLLKYQKIFVILIQSYPTTDYCDVFLQIQHINCNNRSGIGPWISKKTIFYGIILILFFLFYGFNACKWGLC